MKNRKIRAWLIAMNSLIDEKGFPAAGAVEFINVLASSGMPFAILTEDSMHSRKELASCMQKAGFTCLEPVHFYTSVMAGVDLILSSHPEKNKADFIGEKGLEETLREGGMILTQKHPDWLFISVDRQAEYSDYCRALDEVMQGTMMVAMDETLKTCRDGRWRIGSGAVAAMMEEASGKKALRAEEADYALFEKAIRYLGADPLETAWITNNYRFGVHGARKMKILAILIMDGSCREDLMELKEDRQPDYVIDSFAGLLR